jgi:hypothetical protein
MAHEHDMTEQERDFERSLGMLRPAPTALRLEQIQGEARRRRIVRQLHTWRAIAAMLVVGLGLSMLYRPGPQEVERIVEVPVYVTAADRTTPAHPLPPPRPAAKPVHLDTGGSYLVLRQLVLERGLGGLPDRPLPRSDDALQITDALSGGGV